ncbi:MAG: N-acetylglucosamine-6-phosphate deacetylase [Rhodospirillaceae bacterium]|nr:N-acetylglucosamine-6-phosphate deacetylase [Rhodospirillaceae bacterium]
MHALTNCHIHTGLSSLEAHAVLIDGRQIVEIVAAEEIPSEATIMDLDGGHLAPGFIDVQVNGGGGVMFNDAPSVETIAQMAKAHRRFGTTGLLPTLITDSRDRIAEAIEAVAAAMAGNMPGVLGLHLEGPNINPERRGMHESKHIAAFDGENIARLGALKAAKIVTLAPECAAPGVIAALSASDVRVSAGHSEATAEQVAAAIGEGLVGVTHLFNAMSQFIGREPGMVGAALAQPELWCGIIVDGFHVHARSVAAAWRAKRPGKLFLVTDAMAPVGAEMHSFVSAGETITLRDGCCRTPDGRLAGSALDMASAVGNCVRDIAIPLDEALRMAATYPAEFLLLDHRLGKIESGFDASLVWLDKELSVRATWINGDCEQYE